MIQLLREVRGNHVKASLDSAIVINGVFMLGASFSPGGVTAGA
jgi:hypothetical protein